MYCKLYLNGYFTEPRFVPQSSRRPDPPYNRVHLAPPNGPHHRGLRFGPHPLRAAHHRHEPNMDPSLRRSLSRHRNVLVHVRVRYCGFGCADVDVPLLQGSPPPSRFEPGEPRAEPSQRPCGEFE